MPNPIAADLARQSAFYAENDRTEDARPDEPPNVDDYGYNGGPLDGDEF